uniref:Uncharacterized protein n=1 Tax=Arundo donax TaxID=35708 RepID=A0A0A9H8E8_ARUDO
MTSSPLRATRRRPPPIPICPMRRGRRPTTYGSMMHVGGGGLRLDGTFIGSMASRRRSRGAPILSTR